MKKLLLGIVVLYASTAAIHAMEVTDNNAPQVTNAIAKSINIVDQMKKHLDPQKFADFKEHHNKYQCVTLQLAMGSVQAATEEYMKALMSEFPDIDKSATQDEDSSSGQDTPPMTIGQYLEEMALLEKDEKLKSIFE